MSTTRFLRRRQLNRARISRENRTQLAKTDLKSNFCQKSSSGRALVRTHVRAERTSGRRLFVRTKFLLHALTWLLHVLLHASGPTFALLHALRQALKVFFNVLHAITGCERPPFFCFLNNPFIKNLHSGALREMTHSMHSATPRLNCWIAANRLV